MSEDNGSNGVFIHSYQFPSWFRQDLTDKIASAVTKTESGQIIGLPGIGLSSYISQYCYQQANPNQQILAFDLNLIDPVKTEKIKDEIENQLKSKIKTIVFLDSADRLRDPRFSDFTVAIAGWRRSYINQVSFFFAFNRPLNTNDSTLKPIWRLLAENLVFVPVLNQKESDWFADATAKQYQINLTNEQKTSIYRLTGGYMQTIKRLIQGMDKNKSLPELENNPMKDIRLAYHFESILASLPEENEDLRRLANNSSYPISPARTDLLFQLNILTKNNRFASPLLESYLQDSRNECTVKEIDMTKNECLLFEYLKSNLNQICSRETVIKTVWGEKVWEVNEHALDQLVHRLREKLANNHRYVLQTIKSRGFRLKEI